MNLSPEQKDEVITFTQELIRSHGESGNEGNTACVVKRKMEKLGYDEVTVDEFGSVVGQLKGSSPGPVLLFDGHMDVVPVRDPDLWKYDPYGGIVTEDRIWGRGASDMKGALAAMICAPAHLKRTDFAGTVLVSASVAEELLIGTAFCSILDRYKVDAVVIGEPTDLKLGIAEKGRAGIEITSYGRVAHSSRPDLGENAVYRMAKVVEKIRKLPRRTDPFLGEEVIELVEISSLPSPGNGSIPGECRSLWECRLLPGENRESFIKRLDAALGDRNKIQLKIARYNLQSYTDKQMIMEDFLPGWQGDKEGPFICLVTQSLKVNRKEVEYYAAPYGCNALASAGNYRIPTVILGPGDISLAHKPNECVRIDQLTAAAEIYRSIIENSDWSIKRA